MEGERVIDATPIIVAEGEIIGRETDQVGFPTPTRDKHNFDILATPPVRGHLQRFALEWETLTSDWWVLPVVPHGTDIS